MIRFSAESPPSISGAEHREEPQERRLSLRFGAAKAEEVFERPAIGPVIGEEVEAVELVLAHESTIDEATGFGFIADAIGEFLREIQAGGETRNRDEVFHWNLHHSIEGGPRRVLSSEQKRDTREIYPQKWPLASDGIFKNRRKPASQAALLVLRAFPAYDG
jgi:hypothetical protein